MAKLTIEQYITDTRNEIVRLILARGELLDQIETDLSAPSFAITTMANVIGLLSLRLEIPESRQEELIQETCKAIADTLRFHFKQDKELTNNDKH